MTLVQYSQKIFSHLKIQYYFSYFTIKSNFHQLKLYTYSLTIYLTVSYSCLNTIKTIFNLKLSICVA